MYLWRGLIATILGLIWCFSECVQVTVQSVLCLFCCLLSPHLLKKTDRESSTQTELFEDPSCQATSEDEYKGCNDETDAEDTKTETSQELQYPDIKKSLHQVFECAYAELVLGWYTVPEPRDSQPLHGALWKEFDLVVDRFIRRAKDFDLCSASVGCVRILTQHLHDAKQSDRAPAFSSRAEEMAVIRVFSEALVRNLFPESLWGLGLYHCALNEIVAIKVLDQLVTWLSDPDNLNQLVVSQLDEVSLQSSAEEQREVEDDTSPPLLESEDTGELTDEGEDCPTSETKAKKKSTKLKEGWSKFIDKMKSKKAKMKKMKKKEQDLTFEALSKGRAALCEDGGSSMEGSFGSLLDSDSEDSDLESYLTSVQEHMMEFKLSYEMWRVGNWTVSVTNVQKENEELCFTVRLWEKDNPENLHWDVRKTQTDIVYFHNRWQDASSLPPLSAIVEATEREVDDEFKEEARATLEHFLQELVSDTQLGHSQPVFQFLCPLDKLLSEEEHYGGVWGLVSGLAYFLTPGQEEDEASSICVEAKPEDQQAKPDTLAAAQPAAMENVEDHAEGRFEEPVNTNSSCSLDTDICKRVEKDPLLVSEDKTEESEDTANAVSSSEEFLTKAKSVLPKVQHSQVFSSLVSQSEGLQLDTPDGLCLHFGGKSNKKEKRLHKMSSGAHRSKGKEKGGLAKAEVSTPLQKKENWEQLEATKAIFDLLKEISGNSLILNIFDAILKPVMPLVKKKVNSFFSKLNPTETQMASYIDRLREKQWPGGLPVATRPGRSSDEKNETKDRAHQLINARYSSYLILKKTDVETVFKLFQDTEENKKMVYMLLSFLLREFLPGEPALNVVVHHIVKDII